jgi:hypothetical protein
VHRVADFSGDWLEPLPFVGIHAEGRVDDRHQAAPFTVGRIDQDVGYQRSKLYFFAVRNRRKLAGFARKSLAGYKTYIEAASGSAD